MNGLFPLMQEWMILASSATGTNRFRLKKIVGKEMYPSPSCLAPFFQKRTLGSPVRLILSTVKSLQMIHY